MRLLLNMSFFFSVHAGDSSYCMVPLTMNKRGVITQDEDPNKRKKTDESAFARYIIANKNFNKKLGLTFNLI